MTKKLTFWVFITTMNDWIDRVLKELLPQLKNVDEVIISHQITDNKIKPKEWKLWKNIKYFFMFEKWLSKNRNNALKNSTTDICHICDDDLNYIPWFQDIILQEYNKTNFDVISFQVENEKWKKRYNIIKWKYNPLSVLRVWSAWITFNRKKILENNILFNEDFWLWTKYPVWEENIFLHDCYKKWLKMSHSNDSIVIHPDESSWIDYRKELIIARIKVFKKIFWFIWWFAWAFYFTIFHYKFYKNKFSILEFLKLSFLSLLKKN
jgi:hypothetical protein